MKHIWDETIPTACTDGTEIRFNPAFFMKLTLQEQLFLLTHESMHVAYLHMDRLQTRVHQKWNIAADYVINLQLVDRGFVLPKGGLLDKKYAGMSTEDVYKLLPDTPMDDFEMDIKPGKGDPDKLTQDIQDIILRAATASKMAGDKSGSIPGDIQIYLDKLLTPKLPWFRLLQKYLRSFDKSDYSYRKPNRRFFPKYHLPSLYGQSLMNFVVAVDTSGSVSDADFLVFVSEVAGILRMMKPDKITLIQFDTKIKSVNQIKSIRELTNCDFTGRGGTSIRPVLEWAEENKPQLLMVFTDGEFKFFDSSSVGDTLWVIHNNPSFTAPFGKVIHYAI